MVPAALFRRPASALPFWLSLGTVPVGLAGALIGGWAVLGMPLYTWGLYALLDAVLGLNLDDADPETPEADLVWYRAITLIWFPLQFGMLVFLLWYVPQSGLSALEKIGVFFGQGVMSGTIGIVHAHELMHQKNRLERWLGDLLLASVLYSHFRTEHLLVHHLYVGTPRDAVTARYGQSFYRMFLRVLAEGPGSAWRAEAAMLKRRGEGAFSRRNPFWRYGVLQAGMLGLALVLGGWVGLALFVYQAFIAIWQLELVNYVEHFGLVREYLGEGRYEPVQPRHSWNAAHKASNWLLINLQRHSDHHWKPDRRFPLLQNYKADEAPQLPFGYPVMAAVAMVPPLWRRMMNPRVKQWRKQFYPGISDWTPYAKGLNPTPKGAP
jgi:alkane 1-monooxygenase